MVGKQADQGSMRQWGLALTVVGLVVTVLVVTINIGKTDAAWKEQTSKDLTQNRQRIDNLEQWRNEIRQLPAAMATAGQCIVNIKESLESIDKRLARMERQTKWSGSGEP